MKALNITSQIEKTGVIYFPLHNYVKSCGFPETKFPKDHATLATTPSELEANFVDAMSRLAEANGMSRNDVHHLITPMLRMLNTKSSWTV